MTFSDNGLRNVEYNPMFRQNCKENHQKYIHNQYVKYIVALSIRIVPQLEYLNVKYLNI